MHTTTAQNAAHRTDMTWIKSKGKSFQAGGESYISEYLHLATGMAIRKSWRISSGRGVAGRAASTPCCAATSRAAVDDERPLRMDGSLVAGLACRYSRIKSRAAL